MALENSSARFHWNMDCESEGGIKLTLLKRWPETLVELFILGHDVEMTNSQPLSRLVIKEGKGTKQPLTRAAMDHADHCMKCTPAIEVLFATFWTHGLLVTWVTRGMGRADAYLFVDGYGEEALTLLLEKGFKVEIFIHEDRECLALFDLYPRTGSGIRATRSIALRTLEAEIRSARAEAIALARLTVLDASTKEALDKDEPTSYYEAGSPSVRILRGARRR